MHADGDALLDEAVLGEDDNQLWYVEYLIFHGLFHARHVLDDGFF